jgi:FkbM family methyltransferase
MNIWTIFSLFNNIYKRHFPLYRFIYFAYKRVSDRDKINYLNEHIKDGMNVLDIGANIGFYTLLLSELVGKRGMVYAFEPDEENFIFLKKEVGERTNVKLVNAACGDKSGKTYLYKSAKMNIDHQVYKTAESRERVEVNLVSVDDYLMDLKDGIDFVKIDVQGYDCFVFQGMKKTLSRSPDVFIIGELWPFGLKNAGSSADEYISEVKAAGFDINIIPKIKLADLSMQENNKLFYVDFIARRIKKTNQ